MTRTLAALMRSALFGGAVGLVLGIALYFHGVQSGKTLARLEYELLLQEQQKEHVRQTSMVEAQNSVLEGKLTILAEERTRATETNDRLVRDVLRSVQAREGRPPSSSGAAPAPGASGPARLATGAELYREDALFLAGEAARADQIRLELATCTQQYRAVIRALSAAGYGKADSVLPPVTPDR